MEICDLWWSGGMLIFRINLYHGFSASDAILLCLVREIKKIVYKFLCFEKNTSDNKNPIEAALDIIYH